MSSKMGMSFSFFSRKEIKVFDENIPGFSLGTKRFKVKMRVSEQLQRALNDTRR